MYRLEHLPHKRTKGGCKECGVSGICNHNCRSRECKECLGSDLPSGASRVSANNARNRRFAIMTSTGARARSAWSAGSASTCATTPISIRNTPIGLGISFPRGFWGRLPLGRAGLAAVDRGRRKVVFQVVHRREGSGTEKGHEAQAGLRGRDGPLWQSAQSRLKINLPPS
jgi:hypothetical protein